MHTAGCFTKIEVDSQTPFQHSNSLWTPYLFTVQQEAMASWGYMYFRQQRRDKKRKCTHTKNLWEVSGFSLSRDSSSYIMNSSRIVIAQCHRRCWLVAWGSCWHICPAVHLPLPNCTWILYSADGSIPGPCMEKLQCCGHKMTFMIPMNICYT